VPLKVVHEHFGQTAFFDSLDSPSDMFIEVRTVFGQPASSYVISPLCDAAADDLAARTLECAPIRVAIDARGEWRAIWHRANVLHEAIHIKQFSMLDRRHTCLLRAASAILSQ
jgi:hypothetical protein